MHFSILEEIQRAEVGLEQRGYARGAMKRVRGRAGRGGRAFEARGRTAVGGNIYVVCLRLRTGTEWIAARGRQGRLALRLYARRTRDVEAGLIHDLEGIGSSQARCT